MLESLVNPVWKELHKKQRSELIKIQKQIAKRVVLKDDFSKPIKTIAGFDLAFFDDKAIATGVVIDYKHLHIKEMKTIEVELSFPYISTFLTFREGPPIIHIIKSLKAKPEIFFINAHGIAHPRFCGCASYVGIMADVATIGIASRNLCGVHNIEPKNAGDYAPQYYAGRDVGWILKSKEKCRPIFLSPGHRICLRSALDLSLKCLRNRKFPEPAQIAHTIANEEKRRLS